MTAVSIRRTSLSIALGIGCLAVWQAIVVIGDVSELVVPAPTRVVSELIGNGSYLLGNALTTAYETLIGFGLGSAAGVVIAILLHYAAWLRPAIYPYLITAQVLPKIALAPVFFVWLGLGTSAKVAIAALVCFFPVVINMARGLESAPEDLLQMMGALGARRSEMFLKVLMPNSLPYLFAALKVSIGLAIIGAVIGEFVGADAGLGYVLTFTIGNVDTPLMFAALVVLAVMGLGLFGIVTLLERLIVPWQRTSEVRAATA